jgi:hypothetical protein
MTILPKSNKRKINYSMITEYDDSKTPSKIDVIEALVTLEATNISKFSGIKDPSSTYSVKLAPKAAKKPITIDCN